MKVASWNIEGRLSNVSTKHRGSPKQILNNILSINADIMILLEAHSESDINNLSIINKIKSQGYYIYSVPYDDDLQNRSDANDKRLSMVLISRFIIVDFKIVKLGGIRNCIIASFSYNNELITFIGVHLDDRNEKNRLKQTDTLIREISNINERIIIAGDFNTMHGEDARSKLLRNNCMLSLSKYILPSITQRAVEMAKGGSLLAIEKAGLVDADKNHSPTTTLKMRGMEWLPSIRIIQIDHIMITKDFNVKKYVVYVDGGSDHRAISADLNIQQ